MTTQDLTAKITPSIIDHLREKEESIKAAVNMIERPFVHPVLHQLEAHMSDLVADVIGYVSRELTQFTVGDLVKAIDSMVTTAPR